MSEPYIGEIRMFAGTFAPQGWAFCDGQLLAVSSNDALFSLLGTTYGGDGETTFALPDLRGRVAVHRGSGPGLTPRVIGQRSGQENVTLTTNQIPAHQHASASTSPATLGNPANHQVADTDDDHLYNDADNAQAAAESQQAQGGTQRHNNMMPFIGINYIIALFGIYPSRS